MTIIFNLSVNIVYICTLSGIAKVALKYTSNLCDAFKFSFCIKVLLSSEWVTDIIMLCFLCRHFESIVVALGKTANYQSLRIVEKREREMCVRETERERWAVEDETKLLILLLS